jgi:hypothetical protein
MADNHLLFASILLGTFLVARLVVLITKKKSVTLYLRNTYQWDIHHLHLGILLLICAFILGLNETTKSLNVMGLIGVGLILDEVYGFIFSVPYFHKRELVPTVIMFLILSALLVVL